MKYIVSLNDDAYKKFLSRGYIDIKKMPGYDEDNFEWPIYVENSQDNIISGPYQQFESKKGYFQFAEQSCVKIKTKTSHSTGLYPDNEIMDNDYYQSKQTYPVINQDPFFTGFLWRLLTFVGHPARIGVNLSEKPTYLYDYCLNKMGEYGFSPEPIANQRIVIGKVEKIPAIILCYKGNCFVAQSDVFMAGYLLACSKLTTSAIIDPDTYFPDNYYCSFDIPYDSGVVLDYLDKRGIELIRNMGSFKVISPLAISCDFLKIMRLYLKNNIDTTYSSNFKTDDGSQYLGQNYEVLRKKMMSDIMRKCLELLFERNGIDISLIDSKEKYTLVRDDKYHYSMVICGEDDVGNVLRDIPKYSAEYLIYLHNNIILIDKITSEDHHLKTENSEKLSDVRPFVIQSAEVNVLEQYLLDIADHYI